MFCRLQQISLMFTLRSKVTQPLRKNLEKTPCEPKNLKIPPNPLQSPKTPQKTPKFPPNHLLSGCGSDSATRMNPG